MSTILYPVPARAAPSRRTESSGLGDLSEAALTVDRRSLRLGRIGGPLWPRPRFGVTLIRGELEAAGLGDHDPPAAVSLFARSEHTPMTIRVFTSKARTLRKGFIVSHRPSMTSCPLAWKAGANAPSALQDEGRRRPK